MPSDKPTGSDAVSNGHSRDTGRPAQAQPERGAREADQASEPDVFVEVPKVHVGDIYLDVEHLDAHLSLRANVANLVQVIAGVHVHTGKVELDIKDVDAQALLKVRLENLCDILDRTLTTLDQNPQMLQSLLNVVSTGIDDIGPTAQQALGPHGAVGQAVSTAGQAGATRRPPTAAGKRGTKIGTAAARSPRRRAASSAKAPAAREDGENEPLTPRAGPGAPGPGHVPNRGAGKPPTAAS